ncbi:hypothetical protein L0Y49_05190, partial [bacterium]|nr:hypothetical protein [bacterium]
PSLRLKVFSPVSLDIYDALGNHTGIGTTTLLGDTLFIEKHVPNSYYFELGEGKYAGTEKSSTTTIELTGEDFGTFTFVAEEVFADEITGSTTFHDIPVTGSTTATFTLHESDDIASTTLLMDMDSDGVTDAEITSRDGLTESELIAILRGIVLSLDLPDKKEKKILKTIDKLLKELNKEHKNEKQEKKKTGKAFDDLIKKIKQFEKKGILTAEEAGELISIIERIRGEVVE